MFPNTISDKPEEEAIEFTTSSGADVPKATMVRPIIKSDTLYFLAMAVAPLINQFAPRIRQTKPTTIDSIKMPIILNKILFGKFQYFEV